MFVSYCSCQFYFLSTTSQNVITNETCIMTIFQNVTLSLVASHIRFRQYLYYRFSLSMISDIELPVFWFKYFLIVNDFLCVLQQHCYLKMERESHFLLIKKIIKSIFLSLLFISFTYKLCICLIYPPVSEEKKSGKTCVTSLFHGINLQQHLFFSIGFIYYNATQRFYLVL